MAGKKQQKAEKHPKLLGFEELLLISSVPAQDPREKALDKKHHGERFNPSHTPKKLTSQRKIQEENKITNLHCIVVLYAPWVSSHIKTSFIVAYIGFGMELPIPRQAIGQTCMTLRDKVHLFAAKIDSYNTLVR